MSTTAFAECTSRIEFDKLQTMTDDEILATCKDYSRQLDSYHSSAMNFIVRSPEREELLGKYHKCVDEYYRMLSFIKERKDKAKSNIVSPEINTSK